MIGIEEYVKVRREIVNRIKAEMLGPGSEDLGGDIRFEVISDSPRERYSLGILFPQNNKNGQDDGEKYTYNETNEEFDEDVEKELVKFQTKNDIKLDCFLDEDGDSLQEEISMANEVLPSAMGLTFFAKGNIESINIKLSYARYRISKYNDILIKKLFDIDLKKYYIDEYIYEENNFYKLKKNINNKIVSEIISGRTEFEERPEIKTLLYKFASLCTSEEKYCKNTAYTRVPIFEDKVINISFGDKEYTNIFINDTGEVSDEKGDIKIALLRKHYYDDIYSYTVVLVNNKKDDVKYNSCIFQPKIEIDTDINNFTFVDNNSVSNIDSKYIDDEERTFNLLYRNKKNFSVGHGVATGQVVDFLTNTGKVFTDYLPSYEIPQLDFEVKGLESKDILSIFNLSDLSEKTKVEKINLLNKFVDSYEKWINDLNEDVKSLKGEYKEEIINSQIKECKEALLRIKEGVKIIENDSVVYNSFMLMNRAILIQRKHSINTKEDRYPGNDNMPDFEITCSDKESIRWRAFQLAFILINIKALTVPESEERDIVDLIWIPTGGGKTEAYLGLTAFMIFYRRLTDPINGGGTTVIMRYTLRLLAAQQFTRASILICACEYIRKNCKQYNLGKDEITIGLWVGGDPTPNTNKKAIELFKKLTASSRSEDELENNKKNYNKFQVLKCPWCGTRLEPDYVNGKKVGAWGYDYKNRKIMFCPEPRCDFNKKLPIQVVDEELYKKPPTLLFGTVDKFAQITWKEEVGRLFALDCNNSTKSPELIIQDELHLISGPLGTMVGLYETAIDAMCSYKGIKPKIIASTATIKRAKEQCKMLFNRNVKQFPPSGLSIEDNFFTREIPLNDKNRPGRLYIGLMPSGKTATTTQVRLYTTLLESLRFIDTYDEVLDKYWTLVGYFNSIRELGKTSTLLRNDIASNNVRYMKRLMKFHDLRSAFVLNELTSRLSSTVIVKTLKELENIYESNENKDNINHAIDVLLATNMISVGVDVGRLGLMVVSGQPKQTSEYIQATSRVGRAYPGLVITAYNSSKTRDRSHYEMFHSYHQTFYKYVEPTSITPFSEQARERGLHAVFISMVRQILNLKDAKKFSRELDGINDIVNYIIKRSDDLDNSEGKDIVNETRKELDRVMALWSERIDNMDCDQELNYYNKNAEKNLLIPYGEERYSNELETMQSMRNVDNQAGVAIIELGGE